MKTINAQEFKTKLQSGGLRVIDVREEDEYAYAHVPGSVRLPVEEIRDYAAKVSGEELLYLVCQSGNRSGRACEILERQGVPSVVSVEGGIAAFQKAGGTVARQRKTLPIMRQVQIVAGFLVLLGVVLSYAVHTDFRLLSGAIGGGLIFAGLSGFCGVAKILEKMPWNRRDSAASCCGG